MSKKMERVGGGRYDVYQPKKSSSAGGWFIAIVIFLVICWLFN